MVLCRWLARGTACLAAFDPPQWFPREAWLLPEVHRSGGMHPRWGWPCGCARRAESQDEGCLGAAQDGCELVSPQVPPVPLPSVSPGLSLLPSPLSTRRRHGSRLHRGAAVASPGPASGCAGPRPARPLQTPFSPTTHSEGAPPSPTGPQTPPPVCLAGFGLTPRESLWPRWAPKEVRVSSAGARRARGPGPLLGGAPSRWDRRAHLCPRHCPAPHLWAPSAVSADGARGAEPMRVLLLRCLRGRLPGWPPGPHVLR